MTDKQLLKACYDFIHQEWARFPNMTSPMNLLVAVKAQIEKPNRKVKRKKR